MKPLKLVVGKHDCIYRERAETYAIAAFVLGFLSCLGMFVAFG